MKTQKIQLVILIFLSGIIQAQYKVNYNHIEKWYDSRGEMIKTSKEYLYSTSQKSEYVFDRRINGIDEKQIAYPSEEVKDKATRSEERENIRYKNQDSIGSLFIKDFDLNKMTSRNFCILDKKAYYVVKQDLPKMDWKIINEFKTIDNYKCQKATITYLDRSFEAWFTSEIAIQDGPAVFYGLPGLIIEMNSSNLLESYKLTKIEKIEKPIIFNFPKGIEKTYDGLKMDIRMFNRKTIKYLKTKFPDDHMSQTINILIYPLMTFEF